MKKLKVGGRTHLSKYKIVWLESDQTHRTKEAYPNPYNEQNLTYICEDISDPKKITKFFGHGFEVRGWNRLIIVLAIVTPLLLGLFGLLLLLGQITFWETFGTERIFSTFISVMLIWLSIWMTIGGLIQLPNKKIVAAPWWMQSTFDDRLLEHRHPPRYPSKSIEAVHYTAKCPICNGKVNAVAAKIEFFGRIIGRCDNAPAEHVFSFDHVTRTGKSLR